MVKDIFGTPIKKGNLILLSKGNRGHRDFDRGIVIEIIMNPKQIWIKTVEANQHFDYKTYTYTGAYSLRDSRHLASDGTNDNIIVVTEPYKREEIRFGFDEAVKLLIASGDFPATYKLGDSLEFEENEGESVEVETKIEESKELDIFFGLGMPASLKKD